ncbi:MAG: hypothetical protein WCL49_12925 [bacterium]
MSKGMFIIITVLSAIWGISVVCADPSANLTIILGASEAAFPARIEAARMLGKTLSKEEITALYGFLDRKAGEDPAQPGELCAIKNDVVNSLKMQQVMPPDLAGHLIAMYGDRSHEESWRDYCVQHLGDIYTTVGDASIREKVLRVLWSAVDERQGSIPGTGLIALFNLCGQGPVDRTRVAAKALSMVRSPAYGEPAKITALQICADLGEQSVLPDARKLAVNGSVPVRISAMASLGALGDKSDEDLMRTTVTSTDIRLKTAAQVAIKKINAKIIHP